MSLGFGLKYIGAPLAVVAFLIFIYATGYNRGVGAVEAERDADRHAQEKVVAELNGQLREKERIHATSTKQNSEDLLAQEAAYAGAVSRLRLDYAGSLRDSEQRAARYRALAEASPTQCSGLAGYTAKLDASLVEGRSVVEELRSTLELRDSQLKLVGEQLLSDRQLYENYGTDRN